MKQIFALLALPLALLLPSLAHAQFLPGAQPGGSKSSEPALIDRTIAQVEGGVILQSALDQAVSSVKRQYASNPQKLPPRDVLRRQVLNRLILMELQVHEANMKGVRVSQADVNNAVANVASGNHMTPAQLRNAIARSGGSYAAFQQQIASQIMVQKLRNQVLQEKVQVTDAEINNLLKNPTFAAAQVHLAHIEIPIPAGASASDIAAAKARTEQVEQAIHGGMDFNTAAIRYSAAPDALKNGGDLGWRPMSEIPTAFAQLVSGMQPGDVTPPLRGPSGFHILKLLGRRAANRDVVTQYHARQILIKPSELVTPEQAQQKAEDLYQQLTKKGKDKKDFAQLAKENSDDDTSANLGGDLDWFQLKAHGPAVANVLASLDKGEISRPFQTRAGWDIVQLLGKRQKDITEKARRERARQEIANRKARQVYDDYLRQLRSSSYVHILVPALRDPSKQQPSKS